MCDDAGCGSEDLFSNDESSEAVDEAVDEAFGEIETQHHQVPYEKGRFNGRIYLPITSDSESISETESIPVKSPSDVRGPGHKTGSSVQSSTPRSTSANKENTSVVSMSKKKYKSQTPSRQVVKTTRRLSHPAFGTKSGTSSLSSKVSQSASRGHQSSSRAQPSRNLPGDVSVLKELKKTNEILATLVTRIEKTETRMEKVEVTLQSSSVSSSESDGTRAKKTRNRDVPAPVKVICSGLVYVSVPLYIGVEE